MLPQHSIRTIYNKRNHIDLVIVLFSFKTIYTLYERFKVIDMIDMIIKKILMGNGRGGEEHLKIMAHRF